MGIRELQVISVEPTESILTGRPCQSQCNQCFGTGSCCNETFRDTLLKRAATDDASPLMKPDEIVLPTLRHDGSRRWIEPSLAAGPMWKARLWLGWALIAIFVSLPHLRIAGRPVVLLDIAAREFTILGHTFYPTDTPLVACLLLATFLTIMLVTSVAGRVWCGWGCPQTVYTEFLFRPIDRFFYGTRRRGGAPKHPIPAYLRAARIVVYLACCMFLAHTFLSYFVGTERLARWLTTPPWAHPIAFMVMIVTTGAMMFHFLFFREQLCMIACPYGRFQSVMLDRQSLIVAYDARRGEPRGKGNRKRLGPDSKLGDCLDCGRCTAVCPTGIDIRKGLQMECIHCTQCIDACNDVMAKAGLPLGLIRYSSQASLEGKGTRLLRIRPVLYGIGILTAISLFVYILSYKFEFDARILPGQGAPFTVLDSKTVQNHFRLRLVNRSQRETSYSLACGDSDLRIQWSAGGDVRLKPGQSQLIPFQIWFPPAKTRNSGSAPTELIITDSNQSMRQIPFRIHGPR